MVACFGLIISTHNAHGLFELRQQVYNKSIGKFHCIQQSRIEFEKVVHLDLYI